MADQNPQKQIVDKLKDVESILVTVNSNPTVDELSAALGITLLLNKLGKHATAVFSGNIPPAITFLDPEKTFENTTNSLRDFIIALDKEKADHLRYKVDGDMVKIFITPYRTTISESDLDFSQGDYNVEMVIVIGVKDAGDLDRALADHGKIMHDATMASLSVGSESSDLGTINWHDSEASSYSEMLVSISDSLKTDKNLIDEQIATAFLTGIVAATERFSNQLTTSKVMTVAAQLMAAGANQQLIATQLEQAEEIPATSEISASSQADAGNQPEPILEEKPRDRQAPDGSMQISHELSGDIDEVAAQTERENQEAATQKAAAALERHRPDSDADLAAELTSNMTAQQNIPTLDDMKMDLESAQDDELDDTSPLAAGPTMSLPSPTAQSEPSFGGVLNATTEQAAEDKLRAEMADKNRQILSHDHAVSQYVGNPPSTLPAINSFSDGQDAPLPVSTFDNPEESQPLAHADTIEPQTLAPMPVSGPTPAAPTLSEIDAQNRQPHDEARAAIEDALRAGPSTAEQYETVVSTPPTPPELAAPDPQPVSAVGVPSMNELPPLPPMPDFSTLPPLPNDVAQPTELQPPLQDFTPPLGSSEGLAADFPSISPVPQAPQMPPAQADDPNQFQIPGQQ